MWTVQVAQCLHETLQYRVIVFVVGPGWWFEGGYYQIPRARTQPAKEAKEAFRANKPGNSCCSTGLTSFWVKLTAIILLRLNWQWAEVILVPHNISTKSWKEVLGGAELFPNQKPNTPCGNTITTHPPTTHLPSALHWNTFRHRNCVDHAIVPPHRHTVDNSPFPHRDPFYRVFLQNQLLANSCLRIISKNPEHNKLRFWNFQVFFVFQCSVHMFNHIYGQSKSHRSTLPTLSF